MGILLYIQQDAMLHSLFISGNCCTCFRWYLHPSLWWWVEVPPETCRAVSRYK